MLKFLSLCRLFIKGFHNFYSIQQYEDTNCTEMVPVFGLYNKDSKKLHGFGFITVGNIINPRFEQPPPPAIRVYFQRIKSLRCLILMLFPLSACFSFLIFIADSWCRQNPTVCFGHSSTRYDKKNIIISCLVLKKQSDHN